MLPVCRGGVDSTAKRNGPSAGVEKVFHCCSSIERPTEQSRSGQSLACYASRGGARERFCGLSFELSSGRCRYQRSRQELGNQYLRPALRHNPGARYSAHEERIRMNHRAHG